MGTPAAIIVGSVIIAAAILFVFRWEVLKFNEGPGILRLDRWTGTAVLCTPRPAANATSFIGSAMGCEPDAH
jgi:hypothetical protein